MRSYIPDSDIVWLVSEVIGSFSSTEAGKGLPLGNLTSQLLVNVYMNEFDQFVKHTLKSKHYIRYADDFVFLSTDKAELEAVLVCVSDFLHDRLALELHPDKVSIRTLASGVDFLGWVHFSGHRVLRSSTRRRMLRALLKDPTPDQLTSYMGMLRHGNAHALSDLIELHF